MICWLCVHISWVVCSGLPCQRARSPGAPTQYVGLPGGEKVSRAEIQPFLEGYCSDPITLPRYTRRRATELCSPSRRVLLSRACRSTIPTVCTGTMVAPTLSAAAPPSSLGIVKARNSFRSLYYLRAALRPPTRRCRVALQHLQNQLAALCPDGP